jgi:hypothetical protein
VSLTPEIRCTGSGDVALAYPVTGDGPLDMVFVPGEISNIELAWELPEFARFLGRLAQLRPALHQVRYASVYYMGPITMRSSAKGSGVGQLMVMTGPGMAGRAGR